MNINSSIRNKLIFAVFLGCLIPYIIGGVYLKFYTEDWLYNYSVENTNQILNSTCDLIDDSFAADMKQEVEMLSLMDRVRNARYNIHKYTRYEPDTFQYQPSETEQAIRDQFRIMKESHRGVNFIFLGTKDGGYMEFPKFHPTKSYDPRLRPWYQSAINIDSVVISEPYLTNVSNEMVVGFTKKITDKLGSAIGVIGLTVNLNDLTNDLGNIKIGDTGYIMVLSPRHKFLVSPRHREWIMKTPRELGLSGFEVLEKNEELLFEAELDGSDSVLSMVTAEESGWHIISVVDKNEILQKSEAFANILLAIYLMTFALIFLIVFRISKRLTKPILEISYVINRMADFNFKISNDLNEYAKRGDEVGTAASALREMQNNYTEFINQVEYIDQEIRNVNIEKSEPIKVSVSKNNPFHSVIDSMNNLLAKIHLYFDQLQENNKEIVAKNELLTRSRMELLEQLDKVDQQNEYINYLALHDPLTKLPNRRQFINLLTAKLSDGKKGAVILLDLDDFKGINDTLGHVFGDRVIEAIASRLAEHADENVSVCRFGGDEFLILVERGDAAYNLDSLIQKIKEMFSKTIHIENNDIEVRFSMGISLFPDDATDVNQLIVNADLAMYSVKDSGKNGHRYFDSSMMSSRINKSRIEILLRDAIEKDDFTICYQPQINLETGGIYGYEALLRIRESEIPPSEFIPIAEINGSIIQIGRIVTEKVIRQLSIWKNAGMPLKPVSINFSANQLHDSSYLNFISRLMTKYDIEPRYIQIEITESIFLENKHATLLFLKKLKEMGIEISIDDFGTGYSSLNYLTFLPANKIKLDRSLNLRFLEMDNAMVMNSLISLVHSLGLSVIAEGIETKEQVERLKEAKCDFVQGYYFSKPLEPIRIPEIHFNRFKE